MHKLIVITACLMLMSGAHGAVIFSQAPTINLGSGSDIDLNFLSAAGFSIAADDTVRSVNWLGLYVLSGGGSVPLTDNFTINFYSDSAGPDSLLQSFALGSLFGGRTDTGLPGFGINDSTVYDYVADLGTGFVLQAGINYWISIVNDTTSDPNAGWLWGMSTTMADPYVFSTDQGNSWTPSSRSQNMILDNANVPVPATVWLFGSALGLLGWLRRKTG
jgi:hypothetical protein